MTADYVYDGLERLAIRTTQNMTPAGTTHCAYDLGGRLIAEADDTGQTLRDMRGSTLPGGVLNA